jgi:hypothetical protein
MIESSQHPQLFNTLKTLVHAIPTSAPPYCLIGGLALGTCGKVRATQDIDFLILLNDDTRAHLLSSLASQGFTIDTRWADANPMLQGTAIRLRFGAHPIDLIQPRDAHEQDALTRRRLVSAEELSVWVASPEDMILLKLKAGRDQDFLDTISIVGRPNQALDLDYLWSWADRLGLQGELTYVLKAAAPPI